MCDCRIVRNTRADTEWSIAYCSLHAAAPTMFDAAQGLDAALMVLEDVDIAVYNAVDDYLSENIIELRAALAAAKGDLDSNTDTSLISSSGYI